MGKGKGGRGGRGGRYGGGRDGCKQNFFDPTLDTEMIDAPLTHIYQYKQNQNRSSGFQTQYENSKRGRVGKSARDVSQTQQSYFNQGMFSNAPLSRQPSTRAGPPVSAFSSQNFFVNGNRKKSCRASIVTCISALSTQVGRGPYCYRCTTTNRKLCQALFDLVEKSLQDSKKLIDEWAWDAGVSPDHMECERTKVHIMRDGLRSEDKQCHSCKAEVSNGNQSRRMSVFPSQTSQVPGMLGPRLGPTGVNQPASLQSQQKLNPFIQTAPGLSERQPLPILTPEVPGGRSWTMPNFRSVGGQTATYARYIQYPSQASQSQAQHHPHQQQQQDHHEGGDICDFANGGPSDIILQHLDQEYQSPAVNHIVQQTTGKSHISSSVSQENRCANPYMPSPQTTSVEDAPCGQMLQAQQNPFHHLPHALSGQLEKSDSIFANDTAPVQDEKQSLSTLAQGREEATTNPLITPPPSGEKKIASMLNTAKHVQSVHNEEAFMDGGASSGTTQQGTGEDLGVALGPALGQEQPSHFVSSGKKLEQEQKYCCEVIPTYALY